MLWSYDWSLCQMTYLRALSYPFWPLFTVTFHSFWKYLIYYFKKIYIYPQLLSLYKIIFFYTICVGLWLPYWSRHTLFYIQVCRSVGIKWFSPLKYFSLISQGKIAKAGSHSFKTWNHAIIRLCHLVKMLYVLNVD